jgi:hypothetical protein
MKFMLDGRPILAAAFVMLVLTLSPARADVVVHIDKSSQRMAVSVDGATRRAIQCLTAVRYWLP